MALGTWLICIFSRWPPTQTERQTKIQTCLDVSVYHGLQHSLQFTWCQHGLVYYIVSACDFCFCIFISSIQNGQSCKGQSGIEHAIILPQNHFCCFRVLTRIALTKLCKLLKVFCYDFCCFSLILFKFLLFDFMTINLFTVFRITPGE